MRKAVLIILTVCTLLVLVGYVDYDEMGHDSF